MRRLFAAIARAMRAMKNGVGWMWEEVFEPVVHAVDDTCCSVGRGVATAVDKAVNAALAIPKALLSFGGAGSGDVEAKAANAGEAARKQTDAVKVANQKNLDAADTAKQVLRCARFKMKGHDIGELAAELPGHVGIAVKLLRESECARLGELPIVAISQWVSGTRQVEGVRSVNEIVELEPSKAAQPARTATEDAVMSALAARLAARGRKATREPANDGWEAAFS